MTHSQIFAVLIIIIVMKIGKANLEYFFCYFPLTSKKKAFMFDLSWLNKLINDAQTSINFVHIGITYNLLLDYSLNSCLFPSSKPQVEQELELEPKTMIDK